MRVGLAPERDKQDRKLSVLMSGKTMCFDIGMRPEPSVHKVEKSRACHDVDIKGDDTGKGGSESALSSSSQLLLLSHPFPPLNVSKSPTPPHSSNCFQDLTTSCPMLVTEEEEEAILMEVITGKKSSIFFSGSAYFSSAAARETDCVASQLANRVGM